MSAKRKQECSLGHDERAKIRRLSSIGTPMEQLARIWEVDAEEVERILAEDDQESGLRDGDEVVKRLMKDPEELCCPLSCVLMDDPVVAADGVTYERSWVEEAFKRMPHKSPTTGAAISTTVLLPNQTLKSMIVSFKENSVKEIFSVVPRLLSQQALELLKRGEDFVRPLLPDASASKKLASLLLLRLKLPCTDHGDIAKEAVSLFLTLQDERFFREAFLEMKESDLVASLPSLDEESVGKLHRAMSSWNPPCKGLVDREQARRLASRLNEENLRSLWLLIQASLPDDRAWMQAAACLLAGHLNRLEVDLSDLSSELLMEATRFLDDQDAAIAFAKGFFDYDLGISVCDSWPQKSTAFEQGLFLKLALKEGHDLPVDVLLKLRIEERHLGQASADQLLILSEQLGQHDRCVDAAQVAVVAAKVFKSMDQLRRSEEAFLHAFKVNHMNKDAVQGVAGAVASAHSRCKKLEEQCQQLKESHQQLEKDGQQTQKYCKALEERCKELEKSRQQLEKDGQRLEKSHKGLEQRYKELEKSRKELEERCVKLERRPQLEGRSGSALLSIGSSLVWDLSSYDFSRFEKGQKQESDEFQLPCDIKASMSIYPKGHANSDEGKAALFFFLCVDKPAMVKWTAQSGSSEAETIERNLSHKINVDARLNFMPISETNGRITLRILSIQPPGSTLSFS